MRLRLRVGIHARLVVERFVGAPASAKGDLLLSFHPALHLAPPYFSCFLRAVLRLSRATPAKRVVLRAAESEVCRENCRLQCHPGSITNPPAFLVLLDPLIYRRIGYIFVTINEGELDI